MRVFSVPVLASALLASTALLGGPAFAQNAANPSANGQAGNQAMPHHNSAQMQQQLKQSLEKSGFTNVRIRPEAYVVHAQAPDGSHMVMMISPDEVREVIRSGSSKMPPSQGGNTGSAMQNSGGKMGSSGSNTGNSGSSTGNSGGSTGNSGTSGSQSR